MSSLRRILSSRANGARSLGPVTSRGKERSSKNAIRHGLLSKVILLDDESPEGFEELLGDLLDRLQPADGMEFGMIEEMAASYWRMRRAWALETRMMQRQVEAETEGDSLDRMTSAFTTLAENRALALMHRYETRLHLMYQRALSNLLLLRLAEAPNEPSPISGHIETPALPAPAEEEN